MVAAKLRFARKKSVVPFFPFLSLLKYVTLGRKKQPFAPLSMHSSIQVGRDFDQVKGLCSLCPSLEGGDAA